MEAEVRAILRSAVTRSSPDLGVGSRIQQRFAGSDDVLPPPTRDERPRAAELTE